MPFLPRYATCRHDKSDYHNYGLYKLEVLVNPTPAFESHALYRVYSFDVACSDACDRPLRCIDSRAGSSWRLLLGPIFGFRCCAKT
jgi:hypothetical protein